MMRDLIPTLLPEGEFVDFADIRKGDTIVRGGKQFDGSPLDFGVTILRAWVFEPYKTPAPFEGEMLSPEEEAEAQAAHDAICDCMAGVDPNWVDPEISEWLSDERGMGSTVALHGAKMAEQAWHYRLNLTNPLPVETPTDNTWRDQIAELLFANTGRFTKIAFNEIKEGDYILTFDAEDGDITDDHFIGDVNFGKIGTYKDEYGWSMRATETEDTDFIIVLAQNPPYENDDVYYRFT